MVTIKTKLGSSMLEFSAPTQTADQDIKAACKIMAFVGDFPEKCSLCGSDNLHLYHKSPKGNDYYGMKCKACGAEQNFHQRKEGGFYIRYDDKFEKYVPEGKTEQPESSEEFKDDIPY